VSQNLVNIYNLALNTAGTRSRVSTPDEGSREAEVCNLWYPLVRDTILRAAPWSSCRTTGQLALLKERDMSLAWAEGDPEPPWMYAYGLPSDFLYPRYLESFDTFVLGSLNSSNVLLANADPAVLIYTRRQEDPAMWDADLYYAVAQGLAAHIAMPLHGKPGRATGALQAANYAIVLAQTRAANENTVEYDSMPDWLLARGAMITNTPSRFIFQNGPLLSLSGALV